MQIRSSSLPESIILNQAQSASLFGITPRTLRHWEALNSDLKADRPNPTTARYTLAQLAAFSHRMRQPLSIKGAKALGLPLHLFAGFYSRKLLPKAVCSQEALMSGNLLETLQLTEHLRRVSAGEVESFYPDVLSGLRYGFRSAPAEITAIASLLASLIRRSQGQN